MTGTLARPTSLLLGRFDDIGRLRYTGRTVPLSAQAAQDVAGLLSSADSGHPWQGRTFTAGWGTRETLDVTLVDPPLVAEISADISLDAAGRWRHPVRFGRVRADLTPANTPLFGADNEPSIG
ncbi:hypothetical protein [Streptomyces sp. NPDC002889]|uniref:hypothetical protein n=1 Tax=Streptomyces sp. NPDC002889 TaxID=3364669 RepID=UPI003674F4CE